MNRWKPNYIFQHYTDITPSWCVKEKVKFILSDLDGTLAAWNEGADDTFVSWYKSIEEVGTGLIVVSNNNEKRVQEFVNVCKLVGYGNCKKPSTHKIQKELFDKGLEKETTIFLGDQLFTDVWCGKKLGIRTALVSPLGDYEPIQTSSKRWLETIVKKTWKGV